ncbi:MAG: RsmE family RNA methyltransferase [Acholeplasmataceae bacterium]
MQRYFLNDNKEFLKEDINHLKNVMRFKDGDLIEVCFNDKCYKTKLIVKGNSFSYEIIDEIKNIKLTKIRLIQGLPKGNKIDFITKSSTIFGVSEIIFVNMDRSIAKTNNVEHKLNRLEKIIKEASELSKRFNLPKIKFINNISELTLNLNTYFLDELEKNNNYQKQIYNQDEIINVIVGPEGGISSTERDVFLKNGFIPLSLGSLILPTELAHIPFLSHFLPK